MKYALSEIGSPGGIHHTTVILLARGHIVKDFFIIFDKQAGWELTKIFENDKIPESMDVGIHLYAGMVELVDSVDLGSTAKSVQVRVLLPAPNQYNPNQIFPVGDGFGLFVFFGKFEETHFRNGVIKRPESKPRGPRKKKQT